MKMKFIKRADVKTRLIAKWKDAISLADEVGLPYCLPRWDWLKNYEMEMLMKDHFGDDWIVVEWCPFDGIFCRYRRVASRHDLKEARRDIGAVQNPFLNKKMLFGMIDKELDKRPDNLGEKQYWGTGAQSICRP